MVRFRECDMEGEPSLKKISTRDDVSRHPRRDGRCDESEIAMVCLKRFFN
jgi:hypothetical protein